MESLRDRLRSYLEDLNRASGRFFNLAIAGLVLISSVIFVVETYPISAQVRSYLDTINASILLIFAVEYALRFWFAERKIRYFFSPYSLIDLVAILPFFLGSLDISFVLVFRWFRILRLLRFIQEHKIFGYLSSEDSVILVRILYTLFAIVFVYAGLIYQVEHPINSEEFRTFLDALYFAVATMTTVGFGDITPISELGRLLTILMIWSGIVLIPWQVGDLVKRLLKATHKIKKPCSSCGTDLHDSDAHFCRVCGASFEPQLKPDPREDVLEV